MSFRGKLRNTERATKAGKEEEKKNNQKKKKVIQLNKSNIRIQLFIVIIVM